MNLYKILKDQFGYEKFRENQEEIINAVLDGRDVFAAMPTGGGKSICYQLPSVIFEGIVIVVSPLVALMKDQVDEAVENGLKAAFINSSLSGEESFSVYSDLFSGKIKLLYLSPERLSLEGYYQKLSELPIKLFAIDEAHCLSEWGHDFRPDYLNLSKIKKFFPKVPIAAFTATATLKVQSDIIKILKLHNPVKIRASFNRPELFYRIERKTKVLPQIEAFIKDHQGQSGIVYRTSRKDVEKTAAYLSSRGVNALPYHAGLAQEIRKENQDKFNKDKIDVICATIAFGMGINKLNVRFIIHGDLPRSMEGYYQETGRAGRDGLESYCLLLYSAGDIMKIQYHIDNIKNKKEQKKAEENLRRMSSFASVNVCRRRQILEYFGEKAKNNCGFCDVCTDLTDKVNATIYAQKIMSAALRTEERFGMVHLIDIVCGADTEKIRKFNHNKLITWGSGSDKPKHWWRAIAEELIRQEAIYKDKENFNSIKLTLLGRDILYGRKEFFVIRKEENKSVETNIDSLDAEYDESMFTHLKKVRANIALEKKVPPYIIFSDKSLKDMCTIKPIDNNSFLRVHGVGEKKLVEYGPIFISKIKEFLRLYRA